MASANLVATVHCLFTLLHWSDSAVPVIVGSDAHGQVLDNAAQNLSKAAGFQFSMQEKPCYLFFVFHCVIQVYKVGISH